MRLVFRRLWEDSDGMLEFRLTVENEQYRSTHDCYLYPGTIREFGEGLASFPKSIADSVVLESGGEDPKWYGWLRLRAYVYDSAGHSALECLTETRGDELVRASARFSFRLQAAAFNELGKQLIEWSPNSRDFTFEAREA